MVNFSYYNRKFIHPTETINVSKELNNMGRGLSSITADKYYWIGWNSKEGIAFDGKTVFYGDGKFGHWLEYRVAVTDEDKEPDEVWKWVRWEI